MNEQNTHNSENEPTQIINSGETSKTPENSESSTFSKVGREILERAGIPFPVTPEAYASYDQGASVEEQSLPEPAIISEVPGMSRTETTPAVEYGRVVRLDASQVSNPTRVIGHPSNPATEQIQGYVDGLKSQADETETTPRLSDETINRLNGDK